MLKGKEFGSAIGEAIKLKLAAGSASSKAEIARHFGMKPPSLSDWVKKGSVSKDKLPELWRYFSDVVGPDHWGLLPSEWPAGLSGVEIGPPSPDEDPLVLTTATPDESRLLYMFRDLPTEIQDHIMTTASSLFDMFSDKSELAKRAFMNGGRSDKKVEAFSRKRRKRTTPA